ncbi:MAG: 2-oxoacid:acceptor oxidoreductase subunit alpha [Patescibacteria group bacterium]|nr:2-oxoacid:acceptor oxidoreductase subunit alpha [Patescibacteria group bacterium]
MSKKVYSGNKAILKGALEAGLNFYSGYPITPSSEIMEEAAVVAGEDKNFKFIQFEDEIASITGLIGASLGGARGMTATSGPGLSLMSEALGLAYMVRTPLVLVDVQRVGPSTGMPTLPAQGDILQSYHGCHGDYSSIVLYPSSVAGCYQYIQEAIYLSLEAKQPVIFLSDAYLGHLRETVDLEKNKVRSKEIETRPAWGNKTRHVSGLLNLKGTPKTKDTQYYRQHHQKRKTELQKIMANYQFYEHQQQDTQTLVIAYGIMSQLVKKVCPQASTLTPITLFPILQQLKEICEDYQKIVVVEANDGQYAQILESHLGHQVTKLNFLGGKVGLKELQTSLEKEL